MDKRESLALAALGGLLYILWSRNASAAIAPSDGGFTDYSSVDLGGDASTMFSDFTSGVTSMITGSTRGERNNNPGNIRKSSTAWQGMAASQPDPSFVTFSDPVYGIRAIAKILSTYAGRGLNTVSKIISTWAPTSENNTSAYISNVSGALGVSPDTVLNMSDSATIAALVNAIITQENGENIYASSGVVDQGVALA